MKKIFIISLAFVCLLFVGQSYATVEINSGDNAVIVGPHMGPKGITPVTEVIKVSTGTDLAGVVATVGTGAAVGDVMVWDTTNSYDGYHVKKCSVNASTGTEYFAGVMVTTTSRDSRYSYTSPKANGPTVGYMAIRGFCAAKVDTSESATGERLRLNGATLAASFSTRGATVTTWMSQDIGCLLLDTAVDGLMKVWLK